MTDEKGYATTKQSGENARGNLVYDTYTVHEINPPQGMKPVQDFEVTISEEGQTFIICWRISKSFHPSDW